MKKYIITLSCFLLTAALYGQNTVNIKPGTQVVQKGAVTTVYKATAFVNNGTYTDTAGTFLAAGAMIFSGAGTTSLHDFTVNNMDSSTLAALVSVQHTTTLTSGKLQVGGGNLYIRTDIKPDANLVVTGQLTGTAQGLVTIPSATTGPCPLSSALSLNVSGLAALYQWQSSPDSSVWSDVSGATSATYAATVTSVTFYRCQLATNNSVYNEATPGVKLTPTGGPAVSAGPDVAICIGASTTLTATGAATYIWSPGTALSSTSDASVIANPTSNMTYSVIGTDISGCRNMASVNVTVNPLPSAIAGSTGVCVSGLTALTDGTSGGSWASGNTSVATIDPGTGSVSGVSAGTTLISYILPTGCYVTQSQTAYLTPSPISEAGLLCTATTATLSDTDPGGTWSSSNTAIATVDAASGILTGVANGTTTFTYELPGNCIAFHTYSVNSSPAAITGTVALCAGTTTTLSDATGGGIWSSSNTAIATVGSAGLVTLLTAGVANISYSLSSGCSSVTAVGNPTISGSPTICTATNYPFTTNFGGGTWSSEYVVFATVDPSSGVVTGVAAGAGTISYTIGSCYATKAITVLTSPPPFSGTGSLCTGQPVAYTDAAGGGIWSSTDPSIVSAGSLSGFVTGVSAGNAVISYTLTSNGCASFRQVTVSPTPVAISGAANICTATSYAFTDATSGGAWSSQYVVFATVGSLSGIVTGAAAGANTISYTIGGCAATKAITVITSPSAISGTANLCTGLPVTFSATPAMGAWSSSNTSVATIGTLSGVATVVSLGNTIITYTIASTGCSSTKSATASASPASVSGPASICTGSAYTFTDATSGGAWSSQYVSYATVGSSSGVVTGAAAGASTISYTVGGCSATQAITVIASPGAIAGSASLCIGTPVTLAATPSGGTWSSSNTAVSTIGSSSGSVTGVSSGTAVITYTIASTGCSSIETVTVNPEPAAISGVSNVCTGTAYTFTDATSGGVWSSQYVVYATVGSSSGVVTGAAAGASAISYSIGSCYVTKPVSVVTSPGAISGSASLCIGTPVTFTDAGGGTWSSSNTAVSTIGSSSGSVTGVSSGTAIITYTIASTGCSSIKTVTVNPVPAAISGVSNVCTGTAYTFTDAVSGGAWSSQYVVYATVGSSSGVVTGAAAGASAISYTIGSCYVTKPVSVITSPGVISGSASLCTGVPVTFTDAGGGTWSSSDITVSTVGSSSGSVTGVSSGTAVITYTIASTGCSSIKAVTVNPAPAAISGPANVCTHAAYTFTDATSGGVWSSQYVVYATVGSSSGVVTGAAAGVSAISYSIGSCYVTQAVSVITSPGVISGSASLCTGQPVTFTDAGGGTWSSGNTDVSTIGSVSGTATGVSSGTAIISFTIPSTGCSSIKTVTVNPAPAAISGPANVCTREAYTFTDAISGGVWSSQYVVYATVGSSSGVVTGMAAGASAISYTIGSCYVTQAVSVITSPGAISGTGHVALGTPVVLTVSPAGGTWSSSNISAATVGSISGTLTGVALGTTIITYTVASGCITAQTVTVTPPGGRYSPDGTITLCVGSSATASGQPAGGQWSSSDGRVARVDNQTGMVTGMAAGTAVVTYTSSANGTSGGELTNITVVAVPEGIVITAYPGTTITAGQIVKFSASVTNNGTAPAFQWQVNGVAVPGATGATFTTAGLADNDKVSCSAGSECNGPVSNSVVISVVGAGGYRIVSKPGEIKILPNPNNGAFNVKGSLGVAADEEFTLEITDLLGQNVYSKNAVASGGNIDEHILLPVSLANGMYILNVQSQQGKFVSYFVVEK